MPHTPTVPCALRALLAAASTACGLGALAAPAVDPAGASASPPPAASPRAETYGEFRRLFDARSYEQAMAKAQELVRLIETEGAPGSDDLQVALMNLATTQYLAGEYVGAEASYLRVIGLAEASGRPMTERLARANAGLATVYYAGHRYDIAAGRFEQAIALSRRSEGLLNEHQLPLLERYSDSLTELGRYEEALQVQKYAVRIATHKFGERDARVAPSLEKLGRWYARVGAYDLSRSTLWSAIDIVEKAEGPASPNLIGPLTALADCSRRQLLGPTRQGTLADADRPGVFHDLTVSPVYSPLSPAAEGQKALERAAAIAGERPDPSPAQIADVRAQLGDWFEARDQPERALPQYRLAWQAASHVTLGGKPLSESLFDRPVLLHYVRPESWNRYANRPRQEIELRMVRLNVTVTAEGRVRDTKVLEDSGDARRAEQTVQAATTARYRPRFANGQPVETPEVQFMQAWTVLLPKAGATAPEDKPPKP